MELKRKGGCCELKCISDPQNATALEWPHISNLLKPEGIGEAELSDRLGRELYSHHPIGPYGKERTKVEFKGKTLELCHKALALVVAVDRDRLSKIRGTFSNGPVTGNPFARSTSGKGPDVRAQRHSHADVFKEFILSWGPRFGLYDGDGFHGFTFTIYNLVDVTKIYQGHFLPWLQQKWERDEVSVFDQVYLCSDSFTQFVMCAHVSWQVKPSLDSFTRVFELQWLTEQGIRLKAINKESLKVCALCCSVLGDVAQALPGSPEFYQAKNRLADHKRLVSLKYTLARSVEEIAKTEPQLQSACGGDWARALEAYRNKTLTAAAEK